MSLQCVKLAEITNNSLVITSQRNNQIGNDQSLIGTLFLGIFHTTLPATNLGQTPFAASY